MIYLTDRSKFPPQPDFKRNTGSERLQGNGRNIGRCRICGSDDGQGRLEICDRRIIRAVALLYPLLSRFFEKGIMVGAIKG